MRNAPSEANGFSEFKSTKCVRCETEFTQYWRGRRRICTPCRFKGVPPEEKKAREEQRRKNPRMTRQEVHDWLRKGVYTFHNGGQRVRHVVDVDFMLWYKTRIDGRNITGVWQDAFAKWCRGVVINGVMCDKEGKPLDGSDSIELSSQADRT